MALVPVFIPALAVLLHHLEKSKGAPLTQAEVLAVRDKGVCMMMDKALARQMTEKRGYDDLDPENCWEEWQELRQSLDSEGKAAGDGL